MKCVVERVCEGLRSVVLWMGSVSSIWMLVLSAVLE